MICNHTSERAPPPTASAESKSVPASPSTRLAVGEGIGDAFEHGLGEIGETLAMREADERAARARIVVRRALAREIGQKGDG